MTWRRFMVLLRGLSPNSATVNALRIGAVAPSQRVNRIETPEAAQRAFVAMFAPPPTRPVRPS
jgi:hypothetical protein